MAGFFLVMAEPPIPPPPALSPQAALYGRDLLFRGDFSVNPSGDWATVEGEEALKQSIWRILATLPGEYRPYPDYGAGVRAWVKRTQSQADIAELKLRIRDKLGRDPRITQVLEVVAARDTVNLDTLRVFVRILALGNELRYGPFDFKEAA